MECARKYTNKFLETAFLTHLFSLFMQFLDIQRGRSHRKQIVYCHTEPMEQREQCELAQTLPSRERLRVGELSSGIRGRRSQSTEITERLSAHRSQFYLYSKDFGI